MSIFVKKTLDLSTNFSSCISIVIKIHEFNVVFFIKDL